MGAITSKDITESDMPMAAQIQYHLRVNHYPPVNSIFAQVAIAAIELCNTGESSAVLTMPNGINKSAAAIVDGLHLHHWLEESD